jgi:predicted nucleic acid-binding protein
MTTYTADTSVVVPALTSWHEAHDRAVAAISAVSRLPAHVVVESVAVLTRLPHGLSVPVDTAVTVIGEAFPDTPWVLTSNEHRDLVAHIGRSRLRGGQVYDALVGATAKLAGATLLSRDRRAQPVYRAVGAQVEDVAG